MSESIKIKGGVPLHGSVFPVPNKNAILAAFPACILTDNDVVYKNIPNTTDVINILEILKRLGASVDDSNYDHIVINCKSINSYKVDQNLGNVMRASIMLAGPLLARFGRAKIPLPGGCVLGKRSISSHIDAFLKVGVRTIITDGWVEFVAPKKHKKNYTIWMVECSVTATENLLTYCSSIESSVSITDAASEPHVQQLIDLLNSMGADIQGKGSNKLYIKGKSSLDGAQFLPDHDFVDIAGLISAAGLTNGKIRLLGCNNYELYGGIYQTFEKFNLKITPSDKDIIVEGDREIKIDINNSGFPLAGNDLLKFSVRPWPGFPVDCLPSIVALSTKLNGRILIQNWMYETGLDFVNQLNSMGANIYVSDPQRVIVSGPCNFKGGNIVTPAIIQACKAIFLCSLADPVETIISGVEILKRRYPNIIDMYKNMGANIEQL